MRILFAVHQFFPLCYTGTERLVLNLCKQMQKMGHRVKVLTYAISETEGFVEKCGVLMKEYDYQGVPVISIRHKKIPDLVNFSIFDDDLTAIMDDIISREPYDVIHVCHSMRIGEVIRSARKKSIPVVLTLTDFWLMCPKGIATKQNGSLCEGSNDGLKCMTECYPGDSWKTKIIERFQQTKEIFSYASSVVSATRFLKMMFENQGYLDDIAIIRFGKDFRYIRKKEKKYLPDSKITIGYLSSLNPHKGAHILLKAFMQVNPENIRIQIYGDPSASPHYFEILQNISKGHPHIEFCGGYHYEEMPEIFEEIDMIAVPSVWWENSPLVLLRAMAHNVPAIVSDLGGLTEIVTNGHDSFTFKVDDSGLETGTSTDLSEIIKKIDRNPQILNELKANITSPPRIEEEAFEYECLYSGIISSQSIVSTEIQHTSSTKQSDRV